MTSTEYYERCGWALVRELLLLRDSGNGAYAGLVSTERLRGILDEGPPGPGRDQRFEALAHLISGFLYVHHLPDSGLAQAARATIEAFQAAQEEAA